MLWYTIGMGDVNKDRKLEEMEAPKLLRAWKRERRFTTGIIAEVLGVSIQTINQWFAHRARPSVYMQFVIEELTGREVQPKHWLSGQELEFLSAFRRQMKRLRASDVKPPPTVFEKVAGRL